MGETVRVSERSVGKRTLGHTESKNRQAGCVTESVSKGVAPVWEGGWGVSDGSLGQTGGRREPG